MSRDDVRFALRPLPFMSIACAGLLVVGRTGIAGEIRGGGAAASDSDYTPDAVMLRYPDVSATHVAFVFANDIWIAPKDGGTASPLSSPAGGESFPKFSPDGKSIAFTGNYDGNADVYILPLEGGLPTRITYHPYPDRAVDFMPDGRVLFGAERDINDGWSELYVTEASGDGGLPETLPVSHGAYAGVSDDGRYLAFTPYSSIGMTWKRYQGGLAPDIWLADLETFESKRITDHQGLDDLPMWSGSKIYYLSDAGPEFRTNIWSYDTRSGRREQVTEFTEHDVKWPSVGPEEIVFQNGEKLYLLDLDTEGSRPIQIRIPGDRPNLKPSLVDVSGNLENIQISPTGKRAVAAIRGDIWTLPAEHGSPRNLTRTDGVAERDPAWSPDGRWIAYFSDASGEYELTIRQSDGKGDERRLTTDGAKFRYAPVWSPDSTMLTFTDKTGALYLHTIESGETKLVDTDEWANPITPDWSRDSQWLAFSASGANGQGMIKLYNVPDSKLTAVTSDMFHDTAPRFDRSGDYLYFTSNRSFTPVYGDMDWSFIYPNSAEILVVPLRDDVASPFAPESDEETWEGDDESDADDEDADDDGADDDENGDDDDENGAADDANGDEEDDAGDDEANDNDGEDDSEPDADDESDGDGSDDSAEEEDVEPVLIDLDRFEVRAIALPIPAGNYSMGAAGEKRVFYIRHPAAGADGESQLFMYDLEEKEEKSVLESAGAFDLSADGEMMLVHANDAWAITAAGPGAEIEHTIDLSNLRAAINPRREWRQIMTDAWRIYRDFFYDPSMHGVDWDAVGDRYISLVDYATTREDVNYILGEMIGELNSSHTYRWGGPTESAESLNVGMLGCDFELAQDANGVTGYRVKKIIEGAPWDSDAHGPLSRSNVDVKEGDFLIAVNGAPIDTSREPWAAFQGLAGQVVTLVVNDVATRTDSAREVIVEPLDDEWNLRYRAWIEENRRYVDEMTSGRVGYIYVPNTGQDGQNDLIRQFVGQQRKDGLVIDERWNGGGQIPDRFIELLGRPLRNYWAVRDGHDWRWPPSGHFGPKVMLINGAAGSGGDCFPFYFRQSGLGKLVGTRTWGGLIGISGNPGLIDGGYVAVPTFGFYEVDGTWGIEGYGVAPDIEVIENPVDMRNGADPQLDKAIEVILAELENGSFSETPKPSYPDRTRGGVTDEDR